MSYWVLALLLTTVAAASDLWRRGLIPNWITLSLLPFAPLAHSLTYHRASPWSVPPPLFGGALSVMGIVLCGFVPWLLYRWDFMGGADVKLLATLGGLLLPRWGLLAELSALLAATTYVAASWAYQGRLLQTMGRSFGAAALAARPGRRVLPEALQEELPLGPFILLGVVIAGGVAALRG